MRKRKLTPLGIIIKNRLNELGMTQYKLAEKVGTSDDYLYLILTGARAGTKYLSKIEQELGITLTRSA